MAQTPVKKSSWCMVKIKKTYFCVASFYHSFPEWQVGRTFDLWYLTVPGSNGSGTSEDLFWKLDALQTFIRDLHWPEEEFAKHLDNRMKLMSSDMIETSVKRYISAWPSFLPSFKISVRFYVKDDSSMHWSTAPGERSNRSWPKAAVPQTSASHCPYAPCLMWWSTPRTSLLNCVPWRWARRYLPKLVLSVVIDECLIYKGFSYITSPWGGFC